MATTERDYYDVLGVARTASERVISLPMHLQMDAGDVGRVCDVLKTVTTKP